MRRESARPAARPGDGREVVAEQDPFIGGNVIQTVVMTLRRCQSAIVELKHFFGDKQAVKPIGDAVTRYRRDNQPHGIDVFTAA